MVFGTLCRSRLYPPVRDFGSGLRCGSPVCRSVSYKFNLLSSKLVINFFKMFLVFSHLEALWRISRRGSHTASLWGEDISVCLSMRWCPSQIHYEVRVLTASPWGEVSLLSSLRGDVRHRFTMRWGSLPASLWGEVSLLASLWGDVCHRFTMR